VGCSLLRLVCHISKSVTVNPAIKGVLVVLQKFCSEETGTGHGGLALHTVHVRHNKFPVILLVVLLVAPVSNSKSEARRTAQVGRSESIGELEPINSDSSVVFRRVSQGRGS
jgi:hypothetical protein